jgi:hypothetical protein
VLEGAEAIIGSKVAEDGEGVLVRLLNGRLDERRVTIDFARPLAGAHEVLPDEREAGLLAIDGEHRSVVSTVLGPRCAKSVVVHW